MVMLATFAIVSITGRSVYSSGSADLKGAGEYRTSLELIPHPYLGPHIWTGLLSVSHLVGLQTQDQAKQ